MKDNSMKLNYYGLDIGKFLMAIGVVAIHTNPLKDCQNQLLVTVFGNIVTLAVPFFFMASGFLIFQRMGKDICSQDSLEALKKRTRQFVGIYLVWTLLYLPCAIYSYMLDDYGIIFHLADFIRKFLFLGSNSYSTQLWYVQKFIWAMILLYVLLKKKVSLKRILLLSILAYVSGVWINYMLDIHYETGIAGTLLRYFSSIFYKAKFLISFLWICVGAVIARKNIRFSGIQVILCALIGFFGRIFLPAPFTEFALPFEVIAVFQFFLNCRLGDWRGFLWARQASTVLYYMHMYFYFVYALLRQDFFYSGPDAFIVSVTGCLLLSIPVIYLKIYRGKRWVGYLF